jgi:hypothetical protein
MFAQKRTHPTFLRKVLISYDLKMKKRFNFRNKNFVYSPPTNGCLPTQAKVLFKFYFDNTTKGID